MLCSDDARTVFKLDECDSTQCALNIVSDEQRLEYLAGATNIAMAMRIAKDEVGHRRAYDTQINTLAQFKSTCGSALHVFPRVL